MKAIQLASHFRPGVLSLNKLASIYEAENQDQQAEALYLREMNIGEQVWGAEHPDVALFLNNLAFLADKQGRPGQTEEYYLRALRIYDASRGNREYRRCGYTEQSGWSLPG